MKRSIGLIIITIMVFAPLSAVQAEEATKALLLGKVEANLWESAAAIFFHIADYNRTDQRIALNDYKDDIKTIQRMLSRLEEMELSDKETLALADIKKAWNTVKIKGDVLIKIDVEKEKYSPIHESKMHDYWSDVEKLDHKIDELIKSIAGTH